MNYHLCSAAVIDHLQPAEVSRAFQSGYSFDTCQYYVARFDYEEGETYYNEVIEPFNQKSRVAVDFWFRTCNPNHIDETAIGRITLKECRRIGLFVAIENAVNLTNETNRALSIYSLAEKFGCTPVEFINKIAPVPPTDEQQKWRDEFLTLVSGQVDQLTSHGRLPIQGVKQYPVIGSPILDLGKAIGKYAFSFNRLHQAVLD